MSSNKVLDKTGLTYLWSKIVAYIEMLNSIPIGRIDMYAGSTAPTGWLLCNGQAVSRTTYSTLFAVIGTTYGTGDGSTTFNLPDMRNRMAIGAGDLYNLGASGGNKDAIVPYHRHSVTKFNTGGPSNNTSGGMSANSKHTHNTNSVYVNVGGGTTAYSVRILGDNSHFNLNEVNLSHTHSLQNHTHEVGAHNTNYEGTSGNTTNANLPPYRAVNFIIYSGK